MANQVLRGAMKVIYNGKTYVIHPETEINEVEGYSEDVKSRIANNIVKRNSNQFPSNEIFDSGIILYEIDTSIVKFADGISQYKDLPIAARGNINIENVNGLENSIAEAISNNTIQANKVIGALNNANIPYENVNNLSIAIKDIINNSTISAEKTHGNLYNATIDSSNVTGDFDASKVKGTLSGATIDSSNVTGDFDASKVKGTLSGATIASHKVSGLVDSINTQVASMTLAGGKINGELSNASISGSNVTGNIDANQIYGSLDNASVSSSNIPITKSFDDISYTGNGTLLDLLTTIINNMVKKPLRLTSEEFRTQNPILSAGQFAIEIDTGVLKIGDGVNSYTDINTTWVPTDSSSSTPTDVVEPTYMNFEGMEFSGDNASGSVSEDAKVGNTKIVFSQNGSSITINANNLNIGTVDSHDSDVFFEIDE